MTTKLPEAERVWLAELVEAAEKAREYLKQQFHANDRDQRWWRPIEMLNRALYGCNHEKYSSRICEKGSSCCTVRHGVTVRPLTDAEPQ